LVLPGNTVKVPLVGKNMGHPAAFPIGLPEFFIKLFTKSGDTILDPFAGSGTTGLAAEQLNRNVVLIDNKEDYFQTMKRRLSETRSNRERFFISIESKTKTENYATPILLEPKEKYIAKKTRKKPLIKI
jgi:DNA modification methylase